MCKNNVWSNTSHLLCTFHVWKNSGLTSTHYSLAIILHGIQLHQCGGSSARNQMNPSKSVLMISLTILSHSLPIMQRQMRQLYLSSWIGCCPWNQKRISWLPATHGITELIRFTQLNRFYWPVTATINVMVLIVAQLHDCVFWRSMVLLRKVLSRT